MPRTASPSPRTMGLLAYGYGRSFSLAVGSCVVDIGQDVAWDTLVQQSQQAERTQPLPLRISAMTEQVRFPATPLPFVLQDGQPTVAPAVQEAYEHAAEQVRQDLRQRLALTSRKVAYVYVHGFNNTFEDGVLVVAEFWHFLGRQGVPILYTWPAGSGSGLRGYTHDRESGEFTIFHLKQFLRLLASIPELEELNLIAHSRGTDVLTSALRELYIETRAAGKDFRTVYRIKNVVLAAADLDMEVVTQRVAAEYVGLGVERTTIYVSPVDKALGFSSLLFTSLSPHWPGATGRLDGRAAPVPRTGGADTDHRCSGAHRLSWPCVLLSPSGGQCRSGPVAAVPARAGEPGPALTQAWGEFLADHPRLSRRPRHARPLSDGHTGDTRCDVLARYSGWGCSGWW